MLVTSDRLSDGLRAWWEAHWTARIDAALEGHNSELGVTPSPLGSGETDKVTAIGLVRSEIRRRAVEEPGAAWWRGPGFRMRVRPWSRRLRRLERWSAWMEFPSCSRCAPFWVFVLVAAVMVGIVGPGQWSVLVDVTATVAVPGWYVPVVCVVQVPLAARWVYAVVARGDSTA